MWCSQVAQFQSGCNGCQKDIIRELSTSTSTKVVLDVMFTISKWSQLPPTTCTCADIETGMWPLQEPEPKTLMSLFCPTFCHQHHHHHHHHHVRKIWECNIEFSMPVAWNLIATDNQSFCSSFLSSIGHCLNSLVHGALKDAVTKSKHFASPRDHLVRSRDILFYFFLRLLTSYPEQMDLNGVVRHAWYVWWGELSRECATSL